MRVSLFVAALALAGCNSHEFSARSDYARDTPPPPPNAPGYSHHPYTGIPKYLAAARPLQATTSGAPKTTADQACSVRTAACDERLRAVLAGIDGQILALSAPPAAVELQALTLQLSELTPLMKPYPDMASEREELADLVAKLPAMTPMDQLVARRRLVELTDLLRVQLAAAQ